MPNSLLTAGSKTGKTSGFISIFVCFRGLLDAQHVVTAMHDQVWAPHVVKNSFELEVLAFCQRILHRFGAEDPLNMPRQTVILTRIAPELVHAPDGTVGDRSL